MRSDTRRYATVGTFSLLTYAAAAVAFVAAIGRLHARQPGTATMLVVLAAVLILKIQLTGVWVSHETIRISNVLTYRRIDRATVRQVTIKRIFPGSRNYRVNLETLAGPIVAASCVSGGEFSERAAQKPHNVFRFSATARSLADELSVPLVVPQLGPPGRSVLDRLSA